MRIQVSRTGGFAGIARHGEIDTTGRADAAEWEDLARSAVAGSGDGPPAGCRTVSGTASRSATTPSTAPTPGSPRRSGS